MDRDDMPNQIVVTITDGNPIVFSRLPEIFEMKEVVYNANRPLTKEELKDILDIGGLVLNDMTITDKDETPAMSADKAKQIADFISNQMHTRRIPKLDMATKWYICPMHNNYPGNKELRLSLVVTP